jgi:hypothetical protein
LPLMDLMIICAFFSCSRPSGVMQIRIALLFSGGTRRLTRCLFIYSLPQ